MLTSNRQMAARRYLLGWAMTACLVLAALSAPAFGARGQQAGSQDYDPETVYRFDPVTDEFFPIPEDEQKTGSIYLHYDPRLDRHVWSFRQGDGGFWHPFGEGTLQPARLFDVRRSRADALDRLGSANRSLADELRRTGRSAMLRLEPDGHWIPGRASAAPTVYDAQTGRLWQLGSTNYIPVSHSPFGYIWTVRAGKFEPVRGLPAAVSLPIAPACH